MAIAKHATKKTFTLYLFEIIRAFVNFGCIFFACRSFTKFQLIYKVYASFWILHITFASVYSLLYGLQPGEFSMSGLMYSLFYITQRFAHLAILIESFFMDSNRKQITKIFKEFEERFNEEFGRANDYSNFSTQCCISSILSVAVVIASAFLIMCNWDTYKLPRFTTFLLWNSFPSAWALQFRILKIILSITILNEHAAILCSKLNEMGERNIRRVFGHYLHGLPVSKGCIIRVMPHTFQPSEEADEQKLRVYKKFYGDIYNMFKIINENYGWSVLAFMMMYLIYLVINSYWIIWRLITRLGEHDTIIKNLGFLLIVATLLCMMCWQSQNSQEQVSAELRPAGWYQLKLRKCFKTQLIILYIPYKWW